MITTIQSLIQYVIDNGVKTSWSNQYGSITAKPSRLGDLIRITVTLEFNDNIDVFSYFVSPLAATDSTLLQSNISQFKTDIQSVLSDWNVRGGEYKTKSSNLSGKLVNIGI